MALLSLIGFRGTAEIFGHTREVEFDEGSLIVRDLTLDQAKMLIEALATGTIATTKLWDAASAATNDLLKTPAAASKTVADKSAAKEKEPPAEAPTPGTKAETGSSANARASSKGSGKRGSSGSKNTANAEAPAPGANGAAETPAAADGEESGKSSAKGESAQDVPKSNGNLDGDMAALAEKLSGLPSLRAIVGEIHSAGYDSPKKILEICLQLKDHVPALKRSADLENRVPKIASSVGIEA